ncbi:MAG TPA: thioredoxin-dependent thiol peroxidase [Tepidisphaeraceae bacterium]|nr:thioredoxin-dependent thiol peroxidase [Tepidisphaeraceae bacterium]
MADTHGIPEVGSTAPAFSLPASDGSTVDSTKLKGKTVVLYFYPKADTPGCTKEACGFRDTLAQYTKANTAVFGVSPDPVGDVKKFSDKFHLNFPLLADADHSVCEKYGVWQEKTNYGKKYMGVVRTTFVISPQGKIEHIFKNVKADGHEQEVLKWLGEHR